MIDIRLVIIFLIGFVSGVLAGTIHIARRKDGVIHITQGENTDRYLFEFNIPPQKIPRMKNVIFKVVLENWDNQESSQNLQSL